MKKIFFIITIALSLSTLKANSQTFEIRAVNKGSGVIGVEMRAATGMPPNTANYVTDIVFGLKWQSSYNVDLVSSIATNYSIIKSGTRTLKNGFYFQAFSATNTPYLFPSEWTVNNWVEIMSISNTRNSLGTGVFEICEPGFDITTDPDLGVNEKYFTPAINGSASEVLLPVTLISFNATPQKDHIQLSWSTSTEINNKGFEVQRSEKSSSKFDSIGWVGATGNSTLINNYYFTDKQVLPGVEYSYRLKQIDLDGKFSFSAIKQARLADIDNSAFGISPNPALSFLQVSYNGNTLISKVKLRVIDGKGSVISEQSRTFTPGATATLNISALSLGQYYLIIEQNREAVYQKPFQKGQ